MNPNRAKRLQILMLAVVAGIAWPMPALAQVAVVPPPTFSVCRPAAPPTLPIRWRAVGLMAPFLEGQLDIGEFVYDGGLSAMRATVYGLEWGAVDLLITNTDTYRLTGPYSSPTACTSLGRKFNLPSRQWLSGQAACAGEIRLSAMPVQWWKTPGSDSQATWHWFRTDTRLPWRSMFVTRSPDPAIIGDYSMTYFPTFMPVQETKLSALRDFCVAQAKPSRAKAEAAPQTARALMAVRNEAAEAERLERIRTLIPGLSHQACSRMTPVRWPERFVATGIITPISFTDNPYAGLIYYDWHEAASQFAILWQGIPPAFKGLVALKKGIGYQPGRLPSGVFECPAIYPGMVKPDWATAASCQCRGVIDRNASLSPNDVTQIFACPIKWQQHRVMWNWYTSEGRPVVFAESAARGEGAMLTDYHEWLPGQKVPLTDFDLPKECALDNPSAEENASNPSCTDCHTTR